MSAYLHPATRAEISKDIDFLCREARGPITIKDRLSTWASVFATGDPEAFSDDQLKEALSALIVLALANTGFQFGTTQKTYPPKRDVEMIDLGGAFPALCLAASVVSLVPEPERRADLEWHIRSEVERHMEKLQRLTMW